LGHANVAVTLGTYSHWFQKRTAAGLGAMLEALLEKEDGCEMVAEPISGSVEAVSGRTERAQNKVKMSLGLLGFEPRTKGL
jgi:hypothetical protein